MDAFASLPLVVVVVTYGQATKVFGDDHNDSHDNDATGDGQVVSVAEFQLEGHGFSSSHRWSAAPFGRCKLAEVFDLSGLPTHFSLQRAPGFLTSEHRRYKFTTDERILLVVVVIMMTKTTDDNNPFSIHEQISTENILLLQIMQSLTNC